MKREAIFQTLFKRWLAARWKGGSAVFELKRTLHGSIPWSAVKPHQEEALVQATLGQLYYKIPDDSYGQKPFDCFVVKNVDAYVVIAFGKQLKKFYLIHIGNWINARTETGGPSCTEEAAANIASDIVEI